MTFEVSISSCSECGRPVAQDARFCPACGVALGANASAAREARKVVSALFADVVGSTGLAERLDPEDFKSVVDGAVGRMVTAVETFGGAVLQVAGDGMLALFGAPAAHEDDPERAVLAGLRIVEEIDAYGLSVARDWGIEDLAVRVGIETGLVALGLVGGGGKVEYGAAGDALNTAARLQAASEAGTVLVGSGTQRLIGPLFVWDEPREMTLKGKAQPVIAYPVRGQRTAPAWPRAGGIQARIVGRERELALGADAIERVLAGAGGILIVSGEAGIGKSRLVAELRHRFESAPGADGRKRWLEGRCVSYGEGLPYWPFRGLLRDWLATDSQEATPDSRGVAAYSRETAAGPAGSTADPTATSADSRALAEASRRALDQALQRECARLFADGVAERVALLGTVVGVAPGEASGPGEIPPEVLQRQIQESVLKLLARLAQEGALAISLDDLHWADSSSLALLERLFGLVAESRVLLVLAARPEAEHPFAPLAEKAVAELPRRAHHMSLRALGGEADRGLLDALIGAGSLPAELERRLLARAEGNPLYLEELVRSLIDGGALARVGDAWQFDRELAVEVPETVEKVILARIDRLGADAHALLGVASVLGRQFPRPLLETVAGLGESAEPALRELQAADLLHDGAQWPTPMCTFKHTLIQEAVYRSLLKRRRQELHRLALEAVEHLYAERLEDFLGMLAHHASAAGDEPRAVDYHRRAGAAARRVHAVDEAIEQYGEALAAAQRLGVAGSDRDACDSRLRRGLLLFDRGHADAARLDLEEALQGARAASDIEMQVEALIGLVGVWREIDFARASDMLDETVRVSQAAAAPTRLRALARLSIQYAHQLRLDRALATAEQAMEIAQAMDSDEDALTIAMDALKSAAWQLGDLSRLQQLTDQLASMLKAKPEDDFYLQWVLLESAFVPLGAGRFEEATARIEEALTLLRERGRPTYEPLFLDALCWAYRSQGDYERSLAFGSRACELAHEIGHHEWAAWADATLGWAFLDARAPAAAVACLERGMATAETGSAPAQLARCAALLAWARSMLGEIPSAATLAARAGELLAQVSTPPGGAWLFGAHAYVALARAQIGCGEAARAEELLAPLVTAALQSGWMEAIAGGSLVIGQARVQLDDDPGAEAALVRAAEVADSAGLPAPAWEARASLAVLLRRLGRRNEAAVHAERAQQLLTELAEPLSDPQLRAGLMSQAPAAT